MSATGISRLPAMSLPCLPGSMIKRPHGHTRSALHRRGYLSKDGELVAHPELDPLFQDHDALALATTRSINGRIQIRVGDLYSFAPVAFGSGFSMLKVNEQ